ncbi:hypothetical protein [Saccharothrix australiensis]|nr:hypothetical protein [Saccharothrix australiensis]
MAEHEEAPLNPDPPHSPGTPEPPDLDVDPEQFMSEEEQAARRDTADEPPEPS